MWLKIEKYFVNFIVFCAFAVFVLLLVSLFACRSTKGTVEVIHTQDSTNIISTSIYRDTVIIIPGDTVFIQVPLRDTLIIHDTKTSQVKINVHHGQLTVNSICKEKDIIIEKQRQIIESYTKTKVDSSQIKTIVQEKKYIPGFYKYVTWTSISILVLGILYLILKLKIKLPI